MQIISCILYACMCIGPVAEFFEPIRANGTIVFMGHLFGGLLGANGVVKLRTINQWDLRVPTELPIPIHVITLFHLNQADQILKDTKGHS